MKNNFLFFPISALVLLNCSTVHAGDQFKEYMRHVAKEHPVVISAENQKIVSKSEFDAAKWNFFPTPSISHEAANSKPDTSLNKKTTYFRLQQPIWTGGRLTAQLEKAEAQIEVSSEFHQEQKTTVIFRWLQLWSELKSAELKILAYEESRRRHAQFFNQVKSRSEQGYSAMSDVQLSNSRLASVESDLNQVQLLKKQALNRLQQMAKQTIPTEAVLDSGDAWPLNHEQISNWKIKPESYLIDDRLAEHPTIKKMMGLIRLAEFDVTISKARNIPELYVRGEISTGNATGENKNVYFGLASNFGPGLSSNSVVAAAQARVEVARGELDAKRLEITEQIQSDIQVFLVQSDRLKQLERTYTNNNSYLISAERQFLAGRKTWQELMNIAREEVQMLAQIADVKAQVWLAYQRLQIYEHGMDGYLNSNYAVNK